MNLGAGSNGATLLGMTLEFSEVGFAPNFVDYMQAWDMQQKLHADVVDGQAPSTVLLLEHAAVYTAGKRTDAGTDLGTTDRRTVHRKQRRRTCSRQ